MRIVIEKQAQKQFKKLDIQTQINIKDYILEIEMLENPRTKGKALAGDLSGLWRYRVGDYRIICDTDDKGSIIYIVKIAHRSSVYG